MSLEKELQTRSNNACELCGNIENLSVYEVPPYSNQRTEECVMICDNCKSQIEDPEKVVANHWRCLNESMWSEHAVVQVVAWRMLHRLKDEGWPVDLLDMLYLDDEILTWAKATGEGDDDEDKIVHKDSNGAILEAGDTVVLIKDLTVHGGGFTAKRGTAVRNISLVHDNEQQIEGKVEGQQIVITTLFVKKS